MRPDTVELGADQRTLAVNRVADRAMLFEQRRALRFAEVQRDAALVTRHRFPPKRDAIFDRFELALTVTVFRMFDLDHVSAEIREQHRRERRRDHIARVDHAHALEWLVFAFFREREIVMFLDVVGHR